MHLNVLCLCDQQIHVKFASKDIEFSLYATQHSVYQLGITLFTTKFFFPYFLFINLLYRVFISCYVFSVNGIVR